MAYLGQGPFQEFTNPPTKDSFTGDGSTVAFDLDQEVPSASQNALEVYVDNVRQEPGSGKAFTLGVDGSGDTKRITFSAAPANGASIYVINDKTNSTIVAPLQNDLNGTELILDADGDTSITADTDDRIDFKIANVEHFSFSNSSGDTIVKPMVDAKDIKFQQYDGRTLLDINDGGFIGIANGATGSGELRIYEDTDNGTNYSGFKVGAQSADIDYVLPTADGSSGNRLTTNGSGTLSWAATNVPTSADGQALGSTSLEWSDVYLADGGIIYLGADQDTTLTHVADTGILLNSTRQLQFGDSGTYIHQSADGVLDLVSDTEIEINATTIDMNGALDVSGTITSGGVITGTAFTAGSAVLTEAELETLDGITAGTVIASKAIITDANIDITGGRNITISGELDAATLDISGNADIDGTTNLDEVDIDGTVQIDGATTFGVDDTGVDVKFFGATSGSYLLWDESQNKLATAGGTVIDIVKDKLMIASTAVTTTAAELNIVDGGTSATSTTVVDADRVVMNDNGTMVQVAVTDLAAYFDDEITAMPNLVTTAATTVGALDSGSITSGFGAIDNGTSGIRTATFTAETAFVPDAADGATLGTSSLEFSDLYLADGGVVYFGNDQDVTLTHVADTGLLLNSTMQLQFNDASQYINAPSATVLDINATDEIELNATLVDINANVEISGTATTTGVHTFTAVPVFPNDTIETADIQADAITGAKIADNAINSEHYTDGSIDTAHIADDQVTLAKMAHGTDGNLITYDANGAPAYVATGSDGQVLTSTGAGSPPAFEALPSSGKVLQVVSAIDTTETSTGSTSYSDSGLTVNITPGASSSKVLVMVGQNFGITGSNGGLGSRLLRDSTVIQGVSEKSDGHGAGETSYHEAWVAFSYLDSPNTTSQVTYKMQMKSNNGGTVYTSIDGNVSSITVMEISA